MSAYILPAIIVLLFIYAVIKKISVYDCFIEGVKESLKLLLSVFPFLASMFILVELFRASGLSDLMVKALSPLFNAIGVPPELGEIIFVKPVSGNGSLALLEDIFKTYGPDSYIGRCAAVINGSSETTFYIAAVYFSTVKVKKLRAAIPISLFASFAGAIFACLVCKIM